MSENSNTTSRTPPWLFLPTFLLCLVIYVATSSGRLGTWDADMHFTITERLVTQGRVDIPESLLIGHPEWQGRNGLYYAPPDIGQSIFNIPFYLGGYACASVLAHFKPDRAEALKYLLPRGAVTLSNALWMALTVLVVGAIARSFGWNYREQAGAMLLTGFATMCWPYATMGFNQPLATLGQTIGLLGVVRYVKSRRPGDAWIAGLGVALGLVTRLNTSLAVPWYALLMINGKPLIGGENEKRIKIDVKAVIGFCLPIVIALLCAMSYNFLRFENPFQTGYHGDANAAFSFSHLAENILLITISPAKGIIWYVPIVILAFFGVVKNYRAPLAWAVTGIAGTYLIFLSFMYYGHSGVHSWGPRFHTPLMPLVGLMAVLGWQCLPAGKWVRPLASVIIALSIIIQFLAVSSDQSERIAALEGQWGNDYFNRSKTNLQLSPIADRGVVIAHKIYRLQGLGLGLKDGKPSRFFIHQKPMVIFLPAEITTQYEGRPSRHKTLVLRYRYCFDFWWCYAGAMRIIPYWTPLVLSGFFLFLAGFFCVMIRKAIR